MWLLPGKSRMETWVNRLPVHSLNYCTITTTAKGTYHGFTKKKNEPLHLHHPKVKLIVFHP